MNKENTQSRKNSQYSTKNQHQQDNSFAITTDTTKVVFDDMIENGVISRKISDKMEDSCPVGSFLMRRKWELSKIVRPSFTQIKLLPCNS